jgi:hypothetical protein
MAEELVEEWLNRQGYFTIRGIKVGVHEIDLLAIRPQKNDLECRQIEVTASVNPISYISRVPYEIQKTTGRSPTSAKEREIGELTLGVSEWIEKKYNHPEKTKLRDKLAPGPWTRELVVHKVKYEEELNIFRSQGVTIIFLAEIVRQLKENTLIISGASGTNLVDLVSMTESKE